MTESIGFRISLATEGCVGMTDNQEGMTNDQGGSATEVMG
jgi:hypothetical protein